MCELFVRVLLGCNNRSRIDARLQKCHIKSAGEGDHVPKNTSAEPALELAIPPRVHAISNQLFAPLLEALCLSGLLGVLSVEQALRPLEKVVSLQTVSHLEIHWQVVLFEPSFTDFDGFLELPEHKHFRNHCLHMLLFPRLRSTREPELLRDRVLFLPEQESS